MKISRTVSYAVHALLQLADSDSQAPVPCRHLAAEGQMPERFLLQILRSLVTHGILQSTRGVEGGYSLERSPREVSLLEVIEAIDGPITAKLPGYGSADRSGHEAKLCKALEHVTATSRQQLGAIKLSDLLGSSSVVRTE